MSGLWSGDSSGVSMWRSEWGNMRALQEQIDSQAATAATTQHRLTSQLSKLQGDLSQRVDRLSTAFDAFVELSQLRDELSLFADARRWRIVAKQLVEANISRAPAPATGGVQSLADVPGYWLAPAARALPDVIEGGADGGGLAEAARRDEVRTATFVASVAPLLGAASLVAAWLPRAFGDRPAVAITTAQRALWLAATDGLLPAYGVDAVGTAVAARLALVDVETQQRSSADLAARPPAAISSANLPAPARVAHGASAHVAAVEGLRQWCAFLDTCAKPPPPVAADEGVSGGGAADELLAVVRSLVEEGSLEERPLLDRAEQLSAIVSPTGAASASQWDGAAGDVVDLLLVDIRDSAHPGRARFALDLLHDAVAAAADRLLAQAATPPPASIELRAGGRNIRVTSAGADPADVAAATAPAPRVRRLGPVQLGIGASVALLFAVLAVAVAPGWVVPCLAVVGGMGTWWLVERSKQRRADAEDARAAESVRAGVTERVAALASATSDAGDAAAEAGRLRESLRARLDARRR